MKSKSELEKEIKEAQTHVSWAEHKGQHDERRRWNKKLLELMNEYSALKSKRK